MESLGEVGPWQAFELLTLLSPTLVPAIESCVGSSVAVPHGTYTVHSINVSCFEP